MRRPRASPWRIWRPANGVPHRSLQVGYGALAVALYINPQLPATGLTLADLETMEGVTAAAEAYYEWTDSQTPDVPEDGRAFYGRDAVANYFLIGMQQLGVEIFQVEKPAARLCAARPGTRVPTSPDSRSDSCRPPAPPDWGNTWRRTWSLYMPRFGCVSGYLPVRREAASVSELDRVIEEQGLEVAPKTYDCLTTVFGQMEDMTLYANKSFENGTAAIMNMFVSFLLGLLPSIYPTHPLPASGPRKKPRTTLQSSPQSAGAVFPGMPGHSAEPFHHRHLPGSDGNGYAGARGAVIRL